MVGVIWTMQLVHYPLFSRVGEAGYPEYQREHMRRITWIVAPVMFLEAGSAAAILAVDLAGVTNPVAIINLALLALVWLSTFAVQGPTHVRLSQRFDAALARRLVHTNVARTVLWSLRGLLALGMVASFMHAGTPEVATP